MKRNKIDIFYLAGATVTLAVTLASVASFNIPLNASDFSITSRRAFDLPAAKADPAVKPEIKEWTVMVYLVGKSDLEGDGFAIINQMEQLGSSEDLNVVAEWGRSRGLHGDSTVDGDWTGARVYHVEQDNNLRKINSPIVAEMKTVDMGDPGHLANFITSAKRRFPARKYALFICGHGSGWYYPRLRHNVDRGIAFDDETDNFLDTPALGRVLKAGGQLDILFNDSCLLQGLETLYEVKDSVKIMMGAENFAYDHDYYALMKRLHAEPGVSPMNLSRHILADYRKYYAGSQKDGYDLSAVETSAVEGLVSRLDKWTALVMRTNDKAAISAAKNRVKRLDKPYYADLKDFIEIYNSALDEELPGAEALRTGGEELIAYLETDLLIGHVHGGAKLAKIHGLSVQLPGPKAAAEPYRKEYGRLAVSRASNWAAFMDYVDLVE